MSLLPIVTYGHESLTKKTATVTDFDESLSNLVAAMLETMHQSNGVGLAAPQVDVIKKFFVCHVTNDVPRVFVNPQIINTSLETGPYEEGCLSIPGVWAEITRPLGVSVQAWDQKGKLFRLDAEGLLARVIQHEMDHLNGILFIDKLPEKKRGRLLQMYMKKMRA